MRGYLKNSINQAHSRGSILVLAVFLLTLFIGIAALAIDIGYLSTTKNELQNTADAAALAGAGFLGNIYIDLPEDQQGTYTFKPDEIDDLVVAVREVAEKNRAAGADIFIKSGDIVIGIWDEETNSIGTVTLTAPDAVRVKARRDNTTSSSPISTFFAGMFGIDTLSVTAEAVASLSGPLTVAEGELILPIGLSERLFPEKCRDVVAFHPTPTSCAGWHNFFDDANTSDMKQKFYDFIQSDVECKYCDEDTLLNGPEWLDLNFSLQKTPNSGVATPVVTVGESINFTGGTVSALFNGEYLLDYDGDEGTAYKNGTTKKDGKPGNPVEVGADKAKSPAPFITLFDYFRYRDGDEDVLYEENVYAEDGTLLHTAGDVLYAKDDVWSATIPVYKDDTDVDCETTGSNPNTSIEVVGFARVKVIKPNPPPDSTIDVHVDCNIIYIDATGGLGPFGEVRGTIPHLVK
jgi:hypothetical protein